jgi:D-serine deaminase-like pyridoxal phosphate-dependent protein
MERPIFKPVGTPVLELDTPALVVDLPTLEHNLATLHTFFRQRQVKVRPLVSAHLCPALAHQQLATGGTVGGIAVTTLGQAEVFATHGFGDILVANRIITSAKIGRLCALAYQARITVAVDNPRNVADLSAAAAQRGVTLQVAVDIQTSASHYGAEPGQTALELVRTVLQAPHLDFVGLMTSEEPILPSDRAELLSLSRQRLQPLLDTRGLLEQAGIEVRTVSVGGTMTYEMAATLAGVTEVRAGTYALMDARHGQYLSTLRPAARVLTTVTSCPEHGTAITDAGQKAVSIDLGLPTVADIPGASAAGLSAEHCRLHLEGDAENKIDLGHKLWLIPWDIGTCVNLYDSLYAVRHGVVERVWPVAARGHYR